ncbi:flagellin [Cytobacillus sp. FJAT-53684]|uniref:Flagellin n=1 Tax=Cytobacillus mangrovibacter TaxID=3299024 RepID=A0ABW6JX75_9BACI
MKINHNIQALNAYRNLYQNQFNTSKNLEKLSSGLRINRAADDAAGLAISEKMRSQIRGLKQAERNSLDGVSLMQTAEGAMTEVHSMLQRMRELAIQAANDTNTTSDRQAIQLEIDQLTKEIDSIAAKTEFNTRKLLDGSSAADTQYIVGEMEKTNIKQVPRVVDASLATGRYEIGVINNPELTYKLNQPGAGVSSASVIAIEESTFINDGAGIGTSPKVIDSSIKDGSYEIIVNNDTALSTREIIVEGMDPDTGIWGQIDSITYDPSVWSPSKLDVGGFEIDLSTISSTNGSHQSTFNVKTNDLALGEYTIVASDYQVDKDGNKSATIEVFDPNGFSIGKKAAVIGKDRPDAIETIGTADGKQVKIDTSLITQAGTAKVQIENKLTIAVSKVQTDENGDPIPGSQSTPITFQKELTTNNGILQHGGIELTFGANARKGESQFDLTNKALSFQIGANTDQSLFIDVPELSTVKLGIDGLSVLTHQDANDAIFRIEQAVTKISATRSKLGATQNRLEHTISNLQTTHENLTSSESRIRDADMALEMTEFTKNNILNQSAQAMLAQANQLPQGILQLLQR